MKDKKSFADLIKNIPLCIDPCKMCALVDKNKQSHFDNTDMCKQCCWYYDSQFRLKEKK